MSTATARSPARPAALRAWADLLTRQLAALETGDVEAFLELGPASEAAAADAQNAPPDADALAACAALLEAVQERLRAFRDATRAELRDSEERAPAVRRYAPATPANRLDVRL